MRIGIIACAAAALAVAVPSVARGSVVMQERSRFELKGMLGKIASVVSGRSEGDVTTVAVSGNRKMSRSRDAGEIVDLDEDKVYALDLKRGVYRVTTFEELRRHVADARRRAAAERRDAPRRDDAGPRSGAPDELLDGLQIDVDLRSTGRTRTINGFETRQVVLSVTAHEKGRTLEQGGGIALTSDMWLAPKVAALKELTDFDQRYARRLAAAIFADPSPGDAPRPEALSAMHPMLKDVLARMKVEGAKLEGSPILTTVSVDLVPSAEQRKQVAAETEARERKARERAKPELKKGLGGFLGGLAQQVVEKKVERKLDDATSDAASPRLLEMTREVVLVSSTVGRTDLALPAGLRRVE